MQVSCDTKLVPVFMVPISMGSLQDFFNSQIPSILSVRVTPKASSNRFTVELQADGTILVRVYITLVPEDGQVNKALVKMLAKELNLPASALEITHGFKNRNKTIKIAR